MRFAVKNLKPKQHTICRTSGTQITIEPNSFVIIDTDNEQEIDYWLNANKEVLQKCGLNIITSDKEIYRLETSSGNNTFTDVSVVDGFASPIVSEIAEEMNRTAETSDTEYTEENLLKLAKEDLFNICENFGIKYKRSNSVKTLVGLILGSDKV